MKKTLSIFTLVVISVVNLKAQCSLEAYPTDTIVFTCGRELELNLSAFGTTGNLVFNNDFNDQTVGTGWAATPAVTFSNPCVGGADGSTHMWMGDATPQPRILTTQDFDLSTGATLCFDMRFSIQADDAPCEGPDEPDEGVYLQYSVDNGSTWELIEYFDPLGGYDQALTNWNQYCFNIPVAAQTSNTQIRWFQDATSGAEYDHWGLDNVSISVNDPSYSYEWEHNGFLGSTPQPVMVTSDSIFVVTYSDQIGDVCRDTVFVQSIPPEFNVETIADTSICAGDCIDLNTAVDIVVRPFSQPSFENAENQPLLPFGQPAEVELTVSGVDEQLVDASTIESVCLNLNNAFTFNFDLSTLSIALRCPDGTSITLVNSGDLAGTSLLNMCFTSTGAALSSGASPYSGDFQPSAGSFTGLVGCQINGIWTLILTTSEIAPVALESFEITFNQPELSYEGLHAWNPSSSLDDSTLLSPLACPQVETSYELTLTDSFQCASYTQQVAIGINEFQFVDQITSCSPFTWVDGVTYSQNNSSASYVFPQATASGCDSVVNLDLDIVESLNPNVMALGDTLFATQTGVSYQWIDCDNGNAEVVGETSQRFVPDQSGNYAVILSTNGCTVNSSCQSIITDVPHSQFKDELFVYPNPNQGSFRLELGKQYGEVITVVRNAVGQTISTYSKLSVSALELVIEGASGIYFVEVSTNDGNHAVLKIVKQ